MTKFLTYTMTGPMSDSNPCFLFDPHQLGIIVLIIIVTAFSPGHPWIANPHDNERKGVGAGDEQAIVPGKE